VRAVQSRPGAFLSLVVTSVENRKADHLFWSRTRTWHPGGALWAPALPNAYARILNALDMITVSEISAAMPLPFLRGGV
jgi:hypothetical protein